jgi:hypothetical protein
MMEPHAVIGILLFIFLLFQAPLGYLHHKGYAATGGRTFYTYLHLGIGRIMIPLGIINAVLGVQLAGGDVWKTVTIAFGGGSMWLLYMISIVVGEWRRSRKIQQSKPSRPLVNGLPIGLPLNSSPKSSGGASSTLPSTPRKPQRYDIMMNHGYDTRRYANSGWPQPFRNGYENRS